MPRPEKAAPYDPELAPAFEQQLDEKAQALRQALLPLRDFIQRRYHAIHKVDAAKQAAYHRDTQALEAIPQAVYAFSLAIGHLTAALWQEVLAAEAGSGLREAQWEARRGQQFEEMYLLLLSVVDFPPETIPAHHEKMRAQLAAMRQPLPGEGAPPLSKQPRAPDRQHEPSEVVPITHRTRAA